MCRKPLSAFSVGLALLFADVCHGTLIGTEAVDDNFIRGGAGAGVTQNCAGNLLAKKSNSGEIGFTRKAYVKFDLDGHNPDGSQPATFTIRKAGSPPTDFTVNVYGLLAGFAPDPGELGADWSQTEITWNNAPANVDEITGCDLTKASLIGSILARESDDPATAYSVSVDTLSDYLQSDDTVTVFLIVAEQTYTSPSMTFASSEDPGIAGPKLDFVLVPEPPTLVLLLLALVGGGIYGLRRNAQRSPSLGSRRCR